LTAVFLKQTWVESNLGEISPVNCKFIRDSTPI